MDFTPIKSKRLYQQVIQQIKQMIYDRKLKKGDKLPSERDLSTLIGVSRTAIREAFSALEILGIIESRHGEGTFISRFPAGQKIIEPLSLTFILEENSQQEFLQVRTLLEAECARLAALHATPAELTEMARFLDDFARNEDDILKNVAADRNFHLAIAKASRNNLLFNIFTAISDVLKMHITDMSISLVKTSGHLSRLQQQHQHIFEAIRKGEAELARTAVLEHMTFIKQEVFPKI